MIGESGRGGQGRREIEERRWGRGEERHNYTVRGSSYLCRGMKEEREGGGGGRDRERKRDKHSLHLSSSIPSMTGAGTSHWMLGTLP